MFSLPQPDAKLNEGTSLAVPIAKVTCRGTKRIAAFDRRYNGTRIGPDAPLGVSCLRQLGRRQLAERWNRPMVAAK
jgi:hypothetical protein